MSAFFAAALSLPTVVFTVLLVFFVLYALATLIGAADIHWLDGVLGIDHAPDSVLEGAMSFLGVAGIPLTIFGGVSVVFAWIASIAAMMFVPDHPATAVAVGLGSAILGLALGSFAVRPLRHAFVTPPAPQRAALVGKVCTIRSLRVDGSNGTAEVDEAGYIAEVRCFRDNELTRGSKAIVYDYDSKEGIYHVGPIDTSIVS